jgi:hypothetical protein
MAGGLTTTVRATIRGMAARADTRFPPALVRALDVAKILGVRAGERSAHRFTGVWIVVVGGRAFARSWTVKPDGWYAAFRADPLGTIQVGERRVRVRARPVRGERTLDAIEQAYAEKYPTPASAKWVRGFRSKRRRAATLEFTPR